MAESIVIGLLEPLLFLLGIVVSCMIILRGMGYEAFSVVNFIYVANENLAVADAMAIFVPISISAVAIAFASFAQPRASNLIKKIRVFYVFVQTILTAILCVLLAFNAISFANHFKQPAKLGPDQLNELAWQTGATVCIAVATYLLAKLDTSFHSFFQSTINERARAPRFASRRNK